jgi:hypothetical protein
MAIHLENEPMATMKQKTLVKKIVDLRKVSSNFVIIFDFIKTKSLIRH